MSLQYPQVLAQTFLICIAHLGSSQYLVRSAQSGSMSSQAKIEKAYRFCVHLKVAALRRSQFRNIVLKKYCFVKLPILDFYCRTLKNYKVLLQAHNQLKLIVVYFWSNILS